KGCIEKLVQGINGFDIAFPKVIFENGKTMYPENEKEMNYPGISACFLIRKDSLKKLDSSFDENYGTYCEDSDFFIRCGIFGLKARYAKGAVAVHALKEMKDAERRYFLENRNLVYGMIKLRCVLKRAEVPNPFNLRALFKNFTCGIFNFRWFDFSHYERGRSAGFRIKLLLSKHERITKKNSSILFFIFFLAVLSGFFMEIKALCSGKGLHA
ncbi:MAG: hypothetical protein NTV63_05585, partial [Candidatus Woesearchaeota archaeon]|nr:hypothetical protein [Candidatus Woesearchaeota archaeon]